MNFRAPILCLLLASSVASAQQPLATPVPTPSSLSTAKVIIGKLIGELDAGIKENGMLTQQLTATKEVTALTQKAALESQNQINKLSEFATAAQKEAIRAAVDRDKAKLEAHQNAKERDVFLFTISAILTILGVGILKDFIGALTNKWLVLGAWIFSVLAIFGASYAICRFVVKLFAQMIP